MQHIKSNAVMRGTVMRGNNSPITRCSSEDSFGGNSWSADSTEIQKCTPRQAPYRKDEKGKDNEDEYYQEFGNFHDGTHVNEYVDKHENIEENINAYELIPIGKHAPDADEATMELKEYFKKLGLDSSDKVICYISMCLRTLSKFSSKKLDMLNAKLLGGGNVLFEELYSQLNSLRPGAEKQIKEKVIQCVESKTQQIVAQKCVGLLHPGEADQTKEKVIQRVVSDMKEIDDEVLDAREVVSKIRDTIALAINIYPFTEADNQMLEIINQLLINNKKNAAALQDDETIYADINEYIIKSMLTSVNTRRIQISTIKSFLNDSSKEDQKNRIIAYKYIKFWCPLDSKKAQKAQEAQKNNTIASKIVKSIQFWHPLNHSVKYPASCTMTPIRGHINIRYLLKKNRNWYQDLQITTDKLFHNHILSKNEIDALGCFVPPPST